MPPRKADALIPLQDLDLQIHKLKVQRAEKPRQLASAEKKVAHAKDNLAAVQAEIKARKLETEMAVDDREIEGLLAKRAGVVGATEKEIIRVYERVLAAKDDGVALAAVTKYETIEDEGKVIYWQCEACGVGLNMQDVNLLMMGRDIQFCRNCSRVMYLKA